MGINFNNLVNVTPGVVSAGGTALDTVGLLLSQSQYAPYGQVLSFPNQTSVATYFGAASVEALYATNYFNGYDNSFTKPATLLFTRYPQSAIAGFLRGGNASAISLATLKTFTGTIALTVGGTLFTSSAINLSAATSFSSAATIIQAGFTAPTFAVTFDSTTNAFIFTTTGTGATATITYADSGTLSTNLLLNAATGAVISQGQAAASALTFMNTVLPINSNWATFGALFEPVIADKQAFATWVNGTNNRFAFVVQDTDPNALVSGNTTNFGYWLQQNNYNGTIPVVGAGDPSQVCAIMGWAASLQFTRTNGRATLFARSQSGLAPTVFTDTNYANALANGYNVYGAFSTSNPVNNTNLFSNGIISGIFKWADSYINQAWLNANIQLALVNLMKVAGFLPYNQIGYGRVKAAVIPILQNAINFGAITTGVTPSASQIAQIQSTLGFDVSGSLKNQGYYLQVADPGATVRQNRGSPVVTLYYMDGESIQKINMFSADVL